MTAACKSTRAPAPALIGVSPFRRLRGTCGLPWDCCRVLRDGTGGIAFTAEMANLGAGPLVVRGDG